MMIKIENGTYIQNRKICISPALIRAALRVIAALHNPGADQSRGYTNLLFGCMYHFSIFIIILNALVLMAKESK